MNWAQRKEYLYITVDVPESAKCAVNLENNKISVNIKDGSESKTVDVDLFGEIDLEKSRYTRARGLVFYLVKANSEDWPTLTPAGVKLPFVKIDWSRWVDSDDEEGQNGDFGNRDFDMSQLGDLSKMLGGATGGVNSIPDFSGINDTNFDENDCGCDCKAPCVGACGDNCKNECGCECKTQCVGACGDSCKNDCGCNCKTPCVGACGDKCQNDCGCGCKTQCVGECGDSCKNSCGCTCKTPCVGGCGDNCKNSCGCECKTQCVGGCGDKCQPTTVKQGGVACK